MWTGGTISGGRPGSSLRRINQSVIRIAPTAATALPTNPKKRSPDRSNMRNVKVAIRARYETLKKAFRQLGTPIVCKHFGNENDRGRGRLWPRSSYSSISLHWKELSQTGHRGTSGRNAVKKGQIIHSSINTIRSGVAICGDVSGMGGIANIHLQQGYFAAG